jgi:hypothetical protein
MRERQLRVIDFNIDPSVKSAIAPESLRSRPQLESSALETNQLIRGQALVKCFSRQPFGP